MDLHDPAKFEMTPRSWASLARTVPGIVALVLSGLGNSFAAGCCLVLAVWADAIAVWCARRAGWRDTPTVVRLEALVDCVSFVAAPAALVASLCHRVEVTPAIVVFVLAGLYRLARFQIEGMVNGGYRGLPVTYSGYIIPAAALALFYLPDWSGVLVWSVLLPVVAMLMVSKFIVPEI